MAYNFGITRHKENLGTYDEPYLIDFVPGQKHGSNVAICKIASYYFRYQSEKIMKNSRWMKCAHSKNKRSKNVDGKMCGDKTVY